MRNLPDNFPDICQVGDFSDANLHETALSECTELHEAALSECTELHETALSECTELHEAALSECTELHEAALLECLIYNHSKQPSREKLWGQGTSLRLQVVTKEVFLELNVHRDHKAYKGLGEEGKGIWRWGAGGGGGRRLFTYRTLSPPE